MSARAARHVHAHAVAEGTRGLCTSPARRLCLDCGERRARFRYRGAVKTDADHTLCFKCHRALRDSLRELNRRVLPAAFVPRHRVAFSVTRDVVIAA